MIANSPLRVNGQSVRRPCPVIQEFKRQLKDHFERRTLARFRHDGHFPPVKLGDVLDDGKSQSRPAQRATPVLVDTIEALEYPRLTIGRYADAMIGDTNLRPSVGTALENDFDGLCPAVTDRILEEIQDRRLNEAGIAGTHER